MQQTNTSNNNSSKIILSALVVARNEELKLNECLEKLKDISTWGVLAMVLILSIGC